ncbi:MAG: efflux RND transporter periplasmic adaptor subunit, partial [Gammaproteobacteria bacterium]|nr:efflux RND transporter periplasmic adaptor subunit [Gammaproteobacteria bacterium]
MKKFVVIGIALAACVYGVYRYFNQDTSPIVRIVYADRGDVIASVTNTRAGTVDTCRRAGLAPASGGPIVRLHVSDGSAVKQGDLLLELWNEDLKAQVVVAEREAAAARSRAQEVCVASQVARREADRLVKLFERNLASADSKEHAVGTADTRAAACKAARDNTRVADSRIDLARAALERTQLRAPFAGVVAEINGELGEYVTPSPVGIPTPPTVDLIDNTCVYISAPIDEVDAPAVRTGQQAFITLDAFPERRFAGHVSRVAPYVLAVEKQSRTVEVEAIIDDPDQSVLLPG